MGNSKSKQVKSKDKSRKKRPSHDKLEENKVAVVPSLINTPPHDDAGAIPLSAEHGPHSGSSHSNEPIPSGSRRTSSGSGRIPTPTFGSSLKIPRSQSSHLMGDVSSSPINEPFPKLAIQPGMAIRKESSRKNLTPLDSHRRNTSMNNLVNSSSTHSLIALSEKKEIASSRGDVSLPSTPAAPVLVDQKKKVAPVLDPVVVVQPKKGGSSLASRRANSSVDPKKLEIQDNLISPVSAETSAATCENPTPVVSGGALNLLPPKLDTSNIKNASSKSLNILSPNTSVQKPGNAIAMLAASLDASVLPPWLQKFLATSVAPTIEAQYQQILERETSRLRPASKQLSSIYSVKHANSSANVRRNRYTDIVPYDRNRVIIKYPIPPDCSDYINASYVLGPYNVRSYIATQGPKSQTCGDFWEMVWEQNSALVVMLTPEEEKGRVKCNRYWPHLTEGSKFYPSTSSEKTWGLEVQIHTEEILHGGDLVLRLFTLHQTINGTRSGKSRRIWQLHFLVWPDHSASSPSIILKVVDLYRYLQYRAHMEYAGVRPSGCFRDLVIEKLSEGGVLEGNGADQELLSSLASEINLDQFLELVSNEKLDNEDAYNVEQLETPVGITRTFSTVEADGMAYSSSEDLKPEDVGMTKALAEKNLSSASLSRKMDFDDSNSPKSALRSKLQGNYNSFSGSILDVAAGRSHSSSLANLNKNNAQVHQLEKSSSGTGGMVLEKVSSSSGLSHTREKNNSLHLNIPHHHLSSPQSTPQSPGVTGEKSIKKRSSLASLIAKRLSFVGGTPQAPIPIYDSKAAGPPILHCSAGCGRTGTFMTIDIVSSLLHDPSVIQNYSSTSSNQNSWLHPKGVYGSQKIVKGGKEEAENLDLIDLTVNTLREQRISMVQTIDQYALCYEAILTRYARLQKSSMSSHNVMSKSTLNTIVSPTTADASRRPGRISTEPVGAMMILPGILSALQQKRNLDSPRTPFTPVEKWNSNAGPSVTQPLNDELENPPYTSQ